jgi:5'(3')-deoxyribonucleotidase
MKVCLDLDMTLNDMSFTWCNYLGIKPFQVEYFGWIRDAIGIEADQWWTHPSCYDTIKPLPGASEFIGNLAFAGHDICIITHTHNGQVAEIKDEWIKKYLPAGLEIIHSGEKYLHTGNCFLLDDCPRHIYDHMRYNHGSTGAIFNYEGQYGWAKSFNVPMQVPVVTGYEEAYNLVSSLSL